MAFLRSIVPTAAAVAAASALPLSITSLSPPPRPPQHSQANKIQYLSFIAKPSSFLSADCSGLSRSFAPRPSAVLMDAPSVNQKSSPQNDAALPELLTEFVVDMKCEGCVSAVKNKLEALNGVKNVEVDLANQVVRVLGTLPAKALLEGLEQTGRKARLIGQGAPEDFLVSAAVAEFKGPQIFGVVRFAQVSMELARIEASFSGLSPGKHGWSINEYGDLTRGAASTGKVYNPENETAKEAPGDLGTLDANEKGDAFFSGAKQMLSVSDLIGRSTVVYETEDKSDSGITAAVIARSAGVGENYKKVCLCDGTTIWEASNKDFVTSKV